MRTQSIIDEKLLRTLSVIDSYLPNELVCERLKLMMYTSLRASQRMNPNFQSICYNIHSVMLTWAGSYTSRSYISMGWVIYLRVVYLPGLGHIPPGHISPWAGSYTSGSYISVGWVIYLRVIYLRGLGHIPPGHISPWAGSYTSGSYISVGWVIYLLRVIYLEGMDQPIVSADRSAVDPNGSVANSFCF